ncbi:helix-turn-helix domain-containing protein [Prauserella cavernicola]|uniref:Helix-turn-helix transcriptional regulator n=1 Tax=Prauserella cavernicola TaxID=2800127 RepID=A0A934V387_9PSEU|nr:helix-turn-helix transcriptional regulator [Prauserella cavernicola]MBK1787001.1 helix-turn-helix transcriptional regulator [Prauserella cavernicola]
MLDQAAAVGGPLLGEEASGLLDTVRQAPRSGLHVLVTAPGGYGKSALIAALSDTYDKADVQVVDDPGTGSGDERALVVDDAHLLSENAIDRVRERVRDGWPRVVLATRPHPLPPALRALAAELAGDTAVLSLGPLSLARTTELTAAAGSSLDDDLLSRLHRYTAGVPRFLSRLLPVAARLGSAWIPSAKANLAVLDAFGAELAVLDDAVLRFVIAADAGAAMNTELLSELFGSDADLVAETARAAGLLAPDGRPAPIVADAVRLQYPAQRRSDVLGRIADNHQRSGLPVAELADALLDAGVSGPTAAGIFSRAATETTDPAVSVRLYRAAASAGPRTGDVVAGWARASALSGDFDTALLLSDELLTSTRDEHRAEGALIAGTTLARRGELARGEELLRFAGGPAATRFAEIVSIGLGKAEPGPPSSSAAGPTLLAGVAERMSAGLRESLSPEPARTLPTLLGAAELARPANPGTLLPESPAGLAALAALHWGEVVSAETVLASALASAGAEQPFAERNRVLLAWAALLAGDLPLAEQRAHGLRPVPGDGGELFVAALRLGAARRASNLPALRSAWSTAYHALLRSSVSLFALLPLNEITITAARLGEESSVASVAEQITTLLAELGNPPLWTTATRWARFYASVISEDRAAAEDGLAGLREFADAGRYPAVLTEAGAAWLTVLDAKPDVDLVTVAATALHELGLPWDAARLAGQAAIRSDDRAAMAQLLDTARQFQRLSHGGEPAAPTSHPTARTVLSSREQQVAALVVEGLTYKQIGARLYISGKTVEHHMARIRGKIGVTNRGQLITALRELLGRPR